MDIFGRYQTESNPIYKKLEYENIQRYSSFLRSIVESAISSHQYNVSEELVKAINFHAVVGLHPDAGQYRTEGVTVGDYVPQHFSEVPSSMKTAIGNINEGWDLLEPVQLSVFALWAINNIHPFRNGNGRTARAICYFILCTKLGGWLPGNAAMLESIRQEPIRTKYVAALKSADNNNFFPIVSLVQEEFRKQIHNALLA